LSFLELFGFLWAQLLCILVRCGLRMCHWVQGCHSTYRLIGHFGFGTLSYEFRNAICLWNLVFNLFLVRLPTLCFKIRSATSNPYHLSILRSSDSSALQECTYWFLATFAHDEVSIVFCLICKIQSVEDGNWIVTVVIRKGVVNNRKRKPYNSWHISTKPLSSRAQAMLAKLIKLVV
jgi:hypothetical protein